MAFLMGLVMAVCCFLPIVGVSVFGRYIHERTLLWQAASFLPLVIWLMGPLVFRKVRDEIRAYSTGRIMLGFFRLKNPESNQCEDFVVTVNILLPTAGIWFFGRFFDPWWPAPAYLACWVTIGLVSCCFLKRRQTGDWIGAMLMGPLTLGYFPTT